MRIAYISYEFPPDTSGGGIGSYTEQISLLMALAGHSVSVFCGTSQPDYNYLYRGVNVYRIQAHDVETFRRKVVPFFAEVQQQNQFSIIEGPDYGADAYFIKTAFPHLPYIVKLHTPAYIIKEYNNYYLQYVLPGNIYQMLRSRLKCIKGNAFDRSSDIEYQNLLLADKVHSPSRALAKRISTDWGVPFRKITIVPNPYNPNAALLGIPLKYEHKRVIFIGKLSLLKGALDFINIIPGVLKKMPDLKFLFVGDDSFSPHDGKTMSVYISEMCSEFAANIKFTGKVSLERVPDYLAESDIVVCNSLWENYPTVILEAMCAGRVVVGTRTGGIPEIISSGDNGLLVNKKNPAEVVRTILWCYRNSKKMARIGFRARAFMLKYSSEKDLAKFIEDQYKHMIRPL